jgi:hypothetical protein
LRTACTRAIFREQQDREKWRRHCVTFRQERDVARERVRALIGEREAHLVRAGAGTSVEGEGSLGSKRPRDDDEVALSEERASRDSTPTAVAISDSDDDSNLCALSYPSPIYLPLVIDTTPPKLHAPQSPPPRSRSADAVLYSSPTTTKKRDMTAFDVNVAENPRGERRIPMEPVKKRRRKGSPSKASDSGSSTSTAVEDTGSVEVKGTCIPGVLGKNAVEVEELGVHDITNKLKASTEPSSSTPPPKPEIELTHVDLMYVPTNGKLVCRACLYVSFFFLPSHRLLFMTLSG